LNAGDQDDVLQLIEDIGTYLDLKSEPASAYNAKVRLFVSAAKKQNIQAPLVKSQNIQPVPTELNWPKLIQRMTLKTVAMKDGWKLFQSLAKRHGLKPITETSQSAIWRRVVCAGITFSENETPRFYREKDIEQGKREYRFEVSPELLEKTGVLIETWHKRMKNYYSLELSIDFEYKVSMESEAHRITTNIFETELSMTGKDTFELGKHWFYLRRRNNSWNPTLEMMIWKGFSSIPWAEIFTSLVKRQVLHIEKPLAKEIWR